MDQFGFFLKFDGAPNFHVVLNTEWTSKWHPRYVAPHLSQPPPAFGEEAPASFAPAFVGVLDDILSG